MNTVVGDILVRDVQQEPLSEAERAAFHEIQRLVLEKFGINLDQKEHLLRSRLQGALRDSGLVSFRQYLNHVRSDHTGRALGRLAEVVSTNHTYFYREPQHFEALRERILQEIVDWPDVRKSRDLRIWVAGCSSGEEAYTIAMEVSEFLQRRSLTYSAGILATDISAGVVEEAIRASYKATNIAHLPIAYQKKYVRKMTSGTYTMTEALKRMIMFRRFNLMSAQFPFKQQFQIIFCRNVMIYFQRKDINRLLERFHRFIAPNGYLIVGQTESLGREQKLFDYVQPGVYRRV